MIYMQSFCKPCACSCKWRFCYLHFAEWFVCFREYIWKLAFSYSYTYMSTVSSEKLASKNHLLSDCITCDIWNGSQNNKIFFLKENFLIWWFMWESWPSTSSTKAQNGFFFFFFFLWSNHKTVSVHPTIFDKPQVKEFWKTNAVF